MFQNVFKKVFTIFLTVGIFCFQNVFSEAGGLKDRPISVVFVCKPSSQADKPRYYRSTSLFFKRLKNKRIQESGTAYFVGYGAFSSETPTEQLKLAGENGYDLYIFPKNVQENFLNDTVPWIGFVEEKKEIEKSKKNFKSQKKSNQKSKTGKSTKNKKRFLNVTKKNVSQSSSSTLKSDDSFADILKTESSKISETQDQSKKENTVSAQEGVSKPESSISKETSQENLVPKNDFSKSNKNPKTKSSKSFKKNKGSGSVKKDSTSIYSSKKKVESSISKETSQTTTVNDPIRYDFFELSFDSLKFWFSTNVNLAISLESNPILFLIGEKTPEDLLSRKKEEDTWIQFLDFPQDLRFKDGVHSIGCVSAKIPNGISVLHFFFRGDRLIRLRQESFSLNSDGSGKSWELE
ncbi:LIC11612 family fibronectin-binding protein [Leptospira noguchii]|uniref:Uncharacterized protein n=1 Tax=Leptospira noguchii serovar Panama str. CZ214 TaxID=1001595 RepID=T0FJX0_9LEPT|nr:hypothetical protein [Leptospira noguchii]EQA70404.1 hypothetical protein LEP1GSC059_0599 [Leptospira noguchii serovar Panama str. CZ214]